MSVTLQTDPTASELRLIVHADRLEDVFTELARFVAQRAGTAAGEYGEWIPVTLEAGDRATLLVEWLNDLIGRSEVEGRAFDDVRDLRLDEGKLSVEIRGRPVPEFHSDLKAATLHGLVLRPEDTGWRAEVTIDV